MTGIQEALFDEWREQAAQSRQDTTNRVTPAPEPTELWRRELKGTSRQVAEWCDEGLPREATHMMGARDVEDRDIYPPLCMATKTRKPRSTAQIRCRCSESWRSTAPTKACGNRSRALRAGMSRGNGINAPLGGVRGPEPGFRGSACQHVIPSSRGGVKYER